MLFIVLTIVVFVEMGLMLYLYKKLGDPEHRWLIHVFFSFFVAGVLAIPVEKYYNVTSHMWELLVVSIGFVVIVSLVARLREKKRELAVG